VVLFPKYRKNDKKIATSAIRDPTPSASSPRNRVNHQKEVEVGNTLSKFKSVARVFAIGLNQCSTKRQNPTKTKSGRTNSTKQQKYKEKNRKTTKDSTNDSVSEVGMVARTHRRTWWARRKRRGRRLEAGMLVNMVG
jgi:hypothetical protein